MLGVQLADVSTRCSSHAKAKRGAKLMAIYRRGSWACARMRSGAEVQALTRLALARLELTPPPNFFTVAIQQPGNSYPSSRLSLLLVGVFWMYKTSFTLSWTGLLALSSTLVSSQFTWCCWSHWCSAMADFPVSPLLRASLCSLTRVSMRLCVSPTYTLPHWQGIQGEGPPPQGETGRCGLPVSPATLIFLCKTS